MSRKTLLEFPAEFPIKVMGREGSDLRALSQSIVERHAGVLEPDRIRQRGSSDGNFVAITYVVVAQSQDQLDRIYTELTACEAVLMAL